MFCSGKCQMCMPCQLKLIHFTQVTSIMLYAVPETRKIYKYSVACLPERKYIYIFFLIQQMPLLKLTKYDRITCYLCFKLFLIILANTSQNSLTGGISHFTLQYQRNWTICVPRPYILYIPYATTNVLCIYSNIYQT